MKNTIKIVLTASIALCMYVTAQAQHLYSIPNPDSLGRPTGELTSYNGAVYFQYTITTGSGRTHQSHVHLAKYDGGSVSLIANPDNADAGCGGTPTVYNGKLYFRYYGSSGNGQLAYYDGTSVHLIANLDSNDRGIGEVYTVYNGNLYFTYQNANHQVQMAKYDGTTLSLIANPDAGGYYDYAPVAYGGYLYFQYVDVAGNWRLAKYDGSSVSLIANPTTVRSSYYGDAGLTVVGGNLFFQYVDQLSSVTISYLAKYDGSNITLIPNINTTDQGVTNASLTVYGGNIYFLYVSASAASLAKYNGTSISLIPTPAGYSYPGSIGVYGANLYATYYYAAGGINQLAKYDGTNLTVLAGPNSVDYGYQKQLGVLSNKLYLTWEVRGITAWQLASYDGTTAALIPNLSRADVGVDQNTPALYDNGNMYFIYIDSNNNKHLGIYGTLRCTPTVSVTANSTNLDIAGTRTMTATSTNGGTRSMYRWYKNGSLISGATNSVLSYGGALGNGDQIYATITPVTGCGSGLTATSNTITFTKSGSTSKDITVFTMPAQVGSSVINNTAATVSTVVTTAPAGRTSIHPTHIVTSPQSGYSPSYIVNRDFSMPVTYTVRAQDGSSRVWTVTVLDQSGNKTSSIVDALNVATDVNIYPNPATTYINVMAAGGTDVPVITVLEIEGRVMYHQTLPITNTVNHMIDLSDFATGTYFVHVVVGSKVETRSFVIAKQ